MSPLNRSVRYAGDSRTDSDIEIALVNMAHWIVPRYRA